eukprot:CAMPEP_0173384196 /NCGR_PEP_ID=MMETSP1356-20130122/6757_1 /TAXON_ID=77927 ORGANISM="Hemiselmis virescens, Strain PCC157" /NCGR_SAMPLE_ID=MMETSP1356 /ASSEMBLY_ACC=CAM_ASM_000847 /LENGTH=349 /DNA_ID=CAMNT_0014339421 /DNA_START=135 /DNA_END=1183 /DNA_ORIENTATION=+
MAPSSYHVLEIFSLPEGCAKMEEEDRRKVIKGMVKSAGPEGFAENANAHTASISPAAELSVCIVMFWLMGGPFIGLGLLVYFAIFMPLSHFAALCAFFALLAFHPLPDVSSAIANSWFAEANYKYFSYRFVWTDDAVDEIAKIPAWIGAGAPHGVMPFSNLLSIPAINTFTFRKFKGAAASALFRTPMLRYFILMTAGWRQGCTGRVLRGGTWVGPATAVVDGGRVWGGVLPLLGRVGGAQRRRGTLTREDVRGVVGVAVRPCGAIRAGNVAAWAQCVLEIVHLVRLVVLGVARELLKKDCGLLRGLRAFAADVSALLAQVADHLHFLLFPGAFLLRLLRSAARGRRRC